MEPLNILIFDTSSDCLKLSLSVNGKETFSDLKNGFKYAENLIPEIDKCFEQINAHKKYLQYVGVCNGPGSFTGIRIGISTAMAIAYGAKIKSFGFSVFDVYKYIFKDDTGIVIPVIDAKKNRFYCSFIEKDKEIEMFDISLLEINQKIKGINRKITFTGKDFELIKNKIEINDFDYEFIDDFQSKELLKFSEYLLNSGKIIMPPEPIYMRKSEAEISLIKSTI